MYEYKRWNEMKKTTSIITKKNNKRKRGRNQGGADSAQKAMSLINAFIVFIEYEVECVCLGSLSLSLLVILNHWKTPDEQNLMLWQTKNQLQYVWMAYYFW